MKRIIFITMLILLHPALHAIDLHRIIGGSVVSMGRTGCCGHNVWSLQNNPAGIAMLEGWHCGLYYENQWLLKETALKCGTAVKAFPRFGSMGLLVEQFGGSQYNETLFGIAYARAFGPYLHLGLRIDYQLFHWGEGYPDRGALGFALGMQSQLTKKLSIGACLIQPVQRMKTLHEDKLPVTMRLGFAFQFTDDFSGHGEVEKSSEKTGVTLRSGFEYSLFKKFFLRAGAQYHPNVLSFGAGYALGDLQMDVSAEMHPVLGASIQVGICYQWK